MKHRGQIVEKAVRKSGYSLTKLAKSLGISRNTLYNRFDNHNLGYRFIIDVGNIIHYDFTLDFPEIRSEVEISDDNPIRSIDRGTAELLKLEGKYIRLLEKYTKLLALLVRLSNENELQGLKKEILEFIDRQEKA
jgi:predicted DNA-binding protein YlxM (UPF0122 family)